LSFRGAQLTVTNSTVANNQAAGGTGGQGGAGGDGGAGSVVDLSRGKIEGSPGDGGVGGAGGAGGTASGGGLVRGAGLSYVVNATIAYNQAVAGAGSAGGRGGQKGGNAYIYSPSGSDGSGGLATGGGLSAGDGTAGPNSVILANTIVARNSAGKVADDVSGAVNPRSSHNLIGTGGSGGLANGITGNLVGVADPRLGTLADHGGPTRTIALLSGSPARDAGDKYAALDPASSYIPLTTDQRGTGFPRILDGRVDIGAVEMSYRPTLTSKLDGVTVDEGSRATNTGTFDDIAGRGAVTLTASVGTVTWNDAAGTWSWEYTPVNDRGAPKSVTIMATNASGLSSTLTFNLTVKNVPPTITKFSVPATAKAGDIVTLSGTAADPGTDTLGYQWVIIDSSGNSTLYNGPTVHVGLPHDGTYDVYLLVGDGDLGIVGDHAQIVVTT
jgi:hypothetical protein